MGKVAKKVTWMARATTTVVGLAIMLALVLGVATTALAGTGVGARFQLGQTNTVNAVTKLVGTVAGPSLQVDNNSTGAGATALDLQVEAGKAPMKVNSDRQVANLNADKLDGKSEADFYAAGSKVADSAHADQANSATSAQNADTVDGKSASQIGVNGLVWVEDTSILSSSADKAVPAVCPQGKVIIGMGAEVDGGTSGAYPNLESNVEVVSTKPKQTEGDYQYAYVRAIESEPISTNWSVTAYAICATAP
jgi:hypothetical protein